MNTTTRIDKSAVLNRISEQGSGHSNSEITTDNVSRGGSNCNQPRRHHYSLLLPKIYVGAPKPSTHRDIMSQDHSDLRIKLGNLMNISDSFKSIERFRWLWVGLLFLILWPFGMLAESVQATIFGWPFFAFWVLIFVPIVSIGYFYFYAKAAIDLEYSVADKTGED